MIDAYDKAIIAFYLVFVLSLGLVFRRLSKNTSDYFRCGGAMPWWITGVSAWIAGFSAWTFTGAAGKIYETGTLVLCLYYASILPTLVVFVYTARRYRRMRTVTYMEAVRQRFGRPTEQVYTWVKLPMLLVFGGVSLNAIGVFMSAVFGVDVASTLVVLGAAVTVVAVAGGAWAVLASDFVQMFLIVTITLVAAFLALHEPAVGGVRGLVAQLPSSQFHWAELARPQVIVLWAAALCVNALMTANNFENASMYLMVKSDRDARRMVIIPIIGTLVGPLIWLVPPMVARLTHPNLAGEFPMLGKQAAEAAFVAVCRDTMPKGMLALLICAMFGATLTSMDAGLNKGAGIFVRNFYRSILHPAASEKRMLVVSKLCTVVFGAVIVFNALLVAKYRTVGLFDLTNQLAASLGTPLLVPLALGLFIRRTPPWSGWSTVLVGFVLSWIMFHVVDPQAVASAFGSTRPLSDREVSDYRFFAPFFVDTVACAAWFLGTSVFYRATPAADRARVDALFTDMATPINSTAEGIVNQDAVMYRLLGLLCLVYGAFILLLMLIPNPFGGRMCFAFCGGLMFAAGVGLHRLSKRPDRRAVLAATANATVLATV